MTALTSNSNLLLLICLTGVRQIFGNIQTFKTTKDNGHEYDFVQHIREGRSPNRQSESLEPTVLVLGENADNAREGDTVTLHCNVIVAHGTVLQYVRWTLGSAILTEGVRYVNADILRYTIIKTEDTPGRPVYTLVIADIQIRDTGEYRCIIGYDFFGSDYPMQMWANINVRIFIDYVPDFTDPICEAGGGIGHEIWLVGQIMYIDCRVETVNPDLDLEWVWNKHTTPVISRHIRMTPFVENGNTSVSFQITANGAHNLDTFICIASSLTVPGMTRNCTIGPIRVVDHMPTSWQVTYSEKPDVSSHFQGTSGRKDVSTMVTSTAPAPNGQNNTALIFIAIVLGIMLSILILAAIFVFWVNRKRRERRLRTNRSLPAHTYYTCTRTPSDELSSSTIEYKHYSPKPSSAQKLIKLDEHKYDIIKIPTQNKSVSAKKRVAVPYAITDISMGEASHPEYARVHRESPDGASLVSFEGFVDNILYEPTTIGEFAEHISKPVIVDGVDKV